MAQQRMSSSLAQIKPGSTAQLTLTIYFCCEMSLKYVAIWGKKRKKKKPGTLVVH